MLSPLTRGRAGRSSSATARLAAGASLAALLTAAGSAAADGADAAVDRLAGRLSSLERLLSVRARYPDARVMVLAFGETEPATENVTAEGRAVDRRVEVQVIGVERRPDGAEAPPAAASGNSGNRY